MAEKVAIDLTDVVADAIEVLCEGLSSLVLEGGQATNYNVASVKDVDGAMGLELKFSRKGVFGEELFATVPFPDLFREVVEKLEALKDVIVRVELPDDIGYEPLP
jgi:hypothetical protein